MRVVSGAVISSAILAAAFGARTASAQQTRVDAARADVRARPADPEAAASLGRALRRAGRPSEAEAELARAAALANADPKALAGVEFELARVYVDRGDFARAFASCKKLEALAGAAAEGHACAADAYLLWQRASEALVEVSEALAKNPRSYDAHLAEGRARELELDWSRAEAALREAISARPDGVEAHLALGRVLLSAGEKDGALVELRRAVSLDPLDPDALLRLAEATEPGPERAELLERAVRERPSFAAAWLALAEQRLELRRVSEAKQAAEAADRAVPGGVQARLLLGKVALAEGRPDDAIRAGEQVLRTVANSAAAKLLVADGNAKKGEIDLALEAYQAAWGLDHSDPTALVHASEACHAFGRDTSARAFGVRATQEFPAWAPGWAALGDALSGQGEKSAAREAYERALSASGGDLDRDAIRRKLSAVR